MVSTEKTRSFEQLLDETAALRAAGRRVVHCHGPFEFLFPGQVRQLELARQHGDVLVVTVTPGERPVLSREVRIEMVSMLACVDLVAPADGSTAQVLRVLRPNVVVMTADEAARAVDDPAIPAALAEAGATLEVSASSPHPARHLLASLTEPDAEARTYLQQFASKYSAATVVDQLKALSGLRVLVVGDTIIDEYHFVRAFGMTAKATAVSTEFLYGEAYAGGILAVANHVAGFCKQVDLLTCLGGQDAREDFIRRHLKPNVSPTFLVRQDAPTTVKRRYVSTFLQAKLFAVSFFNDHPMPPPLEEQAARLLEGALADHDLVLVADFGHGFITPGLIELLCAGSRFLAVNAQLNSMNSGYNVVTRYSRAEYVSIDEEETRMACRERYAPLEGLMQGLSSRLGCRMLTVTRGPRGSITYARGGDDEPGVFHPVPVFTRNVVDTVGAGDAFLSIASLCACAGHPADLVGFVGNAAGALAVGIVGNKESVEPDALHSYIKSLLS